MAKRCDLLLDLGEALLPVGEARRAYEEVAEGAFVLAETLRDHNRAFRACRIALEGTQRYAAGTVRRMHSVGATMEAARLVVAGEADRAFSPAGGLHYAMADRASGFCVFNDAAIAIEWMRRQGMKIAYVDIDAHHGDGVETCLL